MVTFRLAAARQEAEPALRRPRDGHCAAWFDGPLRFSHDLDTDGVKIIVVIENERGQLIGIEIKAAAMESATHFAGLNRLRRAHVSRLRRAEHTAA